MTSPFPKSSSTSGEGRIVSKVLPSGLSGLEAVTYQYPLKLISPKPAADQKSALVFLLSYGGGLVGGDRVNLQIQVLEEARLSLVTQGHTKIFKSPSPDVITRQEIHVHVADGGGLCLLPDPVQPFGGSVYEQTQIFTVEPAASLCLLDCVTQGRSARGEDWDFMRWKGRNEVWLSAKDSDKPRLLVRDAVILDEASQEVTGRSLQNSMHKHGVFGTMILYGQHMKALGDFFLAEFAILPRLGIKDFRSAETKALEDKNMSLDDQWRQDRLKRENEYGILWSAANVRGCVVVKFGARTVEGGRLWVGDMLQKQGDISDLYGEPALMCMR